MIFISVVIAVVVTVAIIGLLMTLATMGDTTIYVVAYSNYVPAEVDSLWYTEAKADKRAEELGDPWEVSKWQIRA